MQQRIQVREALFAFFIPSASFSLLSPLTVSSCRSCMEDDACGYCYTSSNGSAVTGTCVSASVSQLTSSDGACSNSIIESETHSQWAYGYCPSSYSWMAILGMILYLACFSPGKSESPCCPYCLSRHSVHTLCIRYGTDALDHQLGDVSSVGSQLL